MAMPRTAAEQEMMDGLLWEATVAARARGDWNLAGALMRQMEAEATAALRPQSEQAFAEAAAEGKEEAGLSVADVMFGGQEVAEAAKAVLIAMARGGGDPTTPLPPEVQAEVDATFQQDWGEFLAGVPPVAGRTAEPGEGGAGGGGGGASGAGGGDGQRGAGEHTACAGPLPAVAGRHTGDV